MNISLKLLTCESRIFMETLKKVKLLGESFALGFIITVVLTSNIFVPVIGISLLIKKYLSIIIGLWILCSLVVSVSLALAPWGICNDLKRNRTETIKYLKRMALVANPLPVYYALIIKSMRCLRTQSKGNK